MQKHGCYNTITFAHILADDEAVLAELSSNLAQNSASVSVALRSLVHYSVSERWPGYTSVPFSPKEMGPWSPA